MPIDSTDSGGGWVGIQVTGPLGDAKSGPKGYWVETIDGSIVLPDIGWYHVYFDSELTDAFNAGAGGFVLDLNAIIVTSKKPSFPKAIYVYDANGNLVLRSY